MIFYSPASAPGDGATDDVKLTDLTTEELIARIEELEEQIETMRRRHGIEMKRGMDTVERLKKSAGAREPLPGRHPTHTEEDGYEVVSQQTVAILVDVQNMYYAARNLFNSKLEFSRLLKALVRGRRLTRALAYIVERPGMEQEKFVEVLRRNGYEVRKKLLIERSDGSQKGDWDLGIALDAISMSDKVHSIILVTGDGDFVTLAHFLHTRGVRVEVASFPETTALELIRAADYYHRLNEKVLLPSGQFTMGEPPSPRSQKGEGAEEGSGRPRRPARGPVDDEYDDDDFSL